MRWALLCCLLCSLLSAEESPALQETLQRLAIPADWQREQAISPRITLWRSPPTMDATPPTADPSAQLRFARAEAQRASIAAMTTVVDQSFSLEAYLQDLRQQLLSAVHGAEILEESSLTILGHAAVRWELRFNTGPSVWRQRWYVLSVASDQEHSLLTIVASSGEPAWATWRDTVDDILAPLVNDGVPISGEKP